MKKRILTIVLAASIMATGHIASAAHQDVPDPNDTPARFDISEVNVTGLRFPVYTIRTFSRWRIPDVFDLGFFVIYFDTIGTKRFDYYTLVRSNGMRLTATLWRDRVRRDDVKISNARVRHPTRKIVRVRALIGKMRFGESRVQYRWQVRSLFISGKCRAKLCIDVAPNGPPVAEPIVPTA